MDFPKDFEIQGPWVPVTPKKPISTKRSAASSSDWLGSGDILAGMNVRPDSSWGPSNWRQAVADSPSQQMPPCSNGGEMQTQSFNNPMQMSYRTLLALSDPAITSNMTNLAPLLLAQMGGHGSGSQMMPPASPNQNQLAHIFARESSSQMMPPASPNQNQLAHIFARESSSQMMPPASPNQNQLAQLVARERSSQMMPHASPNQNQLAQLVARERSSQMMPHASPNQNQLAQLVARESSSQMMPPASPNPNQLAQLAQLIARQRSRQMMPPASQNHNQLAACERSSQMMPPASSRQNQFFLNGNSLPASSNSSSNNWQPQMMTPKAQYGLPVPLLPNLNSLPETHMMNTVVRKSVVSPETPANLGKNMRSQDYRAVEIIDLVDDTATSQNNHHNRFCQQTAVQEALLSVAGPGMSSNIVALQQQEGEMNVTPPAEISLQQAEGENPGIDLNKTPEPKPKRKKHRPKVIREGKAAKTPKPVTPKPATPRRAKKTENPPQAKRKYVWKKKKDMSSVENPSEALGESTNPQNGSGSKPVRRNLNFDTEDCQARDDGARPERFTHDAGPQAVISSSNTKSDVQSVGIGTLENPLGVGNSFDLNSSTNPLRNEYVSVPQTPNPPSQPSRQEMMRANQIQAEYIRMLNSITSPPQTARREGENMKKLARMNSHLNTAGNCVISSQPGQNQSASDKIYDALLKGTKRNRSLVDDAQISGHPSHMHAYNGMNRGSENCGSSRNGLCSPEIYKRLRTENMQNEGTSTAYSTFTCNPGSPQTVQADQNTSKAFTFADAQRFMVYKKLRAFQHMLARKQADNTANNRPSQAPSRPFKAVVDYQRAATPVKPSGHNNAGSYQPSTPEKPPEFTSSHDIMSIGPQARIEAYIASSELKQKARGRKKKEQVPVNLMTSKSKRSENEAASSTTEYPHGQESLSTSSPTQNTNINNSQQISFVQDSQGTSKPKGPVSRNSQLGTVVPYMDRIDELVRRLSCLNINDGNKKVTVQEQNALIPYVGGDGAMVVFEGKKRKPRPKVDLDPESDRIWRLLMGREVEGDAEMGVGKEKWWEEERRVFRGRAESFIARMHLVQGDRRFSKWKGSVVDSVVGVFLTQNVSDHLSSSAFMSLVAKFPVRSSGTNNTTNLENISRPVTSNDTLSGEGRMSEQQSCDPSSVVIHEVASADEKEMMSSNESPESNTGSSNSDYLGINNVNSHELELGVGRESPDSGSATAVTVTSSTSGIEGEDRSSMEDVVSSQNSVASQNFSKYHVQTADQDKVNSLLNFESDLLSGGMGNGFNSFTELLKMANSRGLQELNGPGNGRTLSTEHSPGINQFRKVGIDEMPSLPNPPSYLCGAGPSICTSNFHLQSIQSDFRSSSYAPSLSSYYQNCLSSNIMGLENTGTVEGKLSNASSAASGINKTNGTEVMGRQCSPLAEKSTKGMDHHPLLASRVASIDTYAPIKESPMQPGTLLGSEIRVEMHSSCQRNVVKETIQASDRTCSGKLSLSSEDIAVFQQREREAIWQVESTQHGVKAEGQKGNQLTPQTCSIEQTNNAKNQENLLEGVGAVKRNSRKEASSSQKVSEASKNTSKGKKVKPETDKKKSFDWDSLRKQACCDGDKKERSSDTMDSLDYEALRNADVNVISHTIRERGMNNMLAERIKEFLNRLVRDHGSTDLEWLRYVPPDKAKDYLLSIRGLGLKSVECVRLLTLHHLAFPVDTNVGRICVRLGWVPLQPLPESLQLHLLEMYPILETIQKYLWPRLCKLDQRTLYELHYQLITFGKVFCTKSKPNCNACPMRGECKHFASAFASARLALPGPEEKGLVSSTRTSFPEGIHVPVLKTVPLSQLEGSTQAQDQTVPRICEPIIEEPVSPGPECVETLESAIEDDFFDDPDEIPTIKLNMEEFTQNLQSYMQQNNMDLQDGDMSKALVAITPDSANIPMPKLKNVSRLRTEHQVYELPDSHPLLEGLDKRERDDPSPYLLAIWTPGETAQSTETPKVYCDSQDTGNLCMAHDCFSCNSIREAKAQLVRGTILIPCRTAMRGSFPLNGTYFQVNEVFADHDSSRVPIDVPRNWIWNLPRRTVYFGTSVTTIFKGLTTEGIQQCFWRGFVCVRGFDRKSCSPKPLYARLHFPASKTTKEKRTAAEAEAAAAAAAAAAAKAK